MSSAAAALREFIRDPAAENRAAITNVMEAFYRLPAHDGPSANGGAHPTPGSLKLLLVEDDFASRLLLRTFLSRYGGCQVVLNGKEAVNAFRSASQHGQRYDLICLDIMMPEMDGMKRSARCARLKKREVLPRHAARKSL